MVIDTSMSVYVIIVQDDTQNYRIDSYCSGLVFVENPEGILDASHYCTDMPYNCSIEYQEYNYCDNSFRQKQIE